MKHSDVFMVRTDDAIKGALAAKGWTVTARAHTHCKTCRDTPPLGTMMRSRR